MRFSEQLKESILHLNLLNHPFYQDWMTGQLSLKTLKEYSQQYYHHVKAFPLYLSTTHSQCDDILKRRVLLENLMDEEGIHGENHPELWLRFAEGLGVDRQDIKSSNAEEPIRNVIQVFFAQAQASYVEGLSSLYAYEYQVPEIAETKIEGLIKNYNLNDERSLSFFEVHKHADKYHREACESLIDQFSESEQPKALMAAKASAQSLWDFLSHLQFKNAV